MPTALAALGAGPSGFTPSQLAPHAWFKADSLALSNNDPVSTWTDSSGNARDATGVTTTRPLYIANARNGLPVVRFDGTDDTMATALFTTVPLPFGFAFACKFNATAAMAVLSFVAAGLVSLTSQGTATVIDLYNGALFPTAATTTSWHVYVGSFGAGADSSMSVDGGAANVGNAGVLLGATRVELGSQTGLSFGAVDIGEAMMFASPLSAANAAATAFYLKSRWGVA